MGRWLTFKRRLPDVPNRGQFETQGTAWFIYIPSTFLSTRKRHEFKICDCDPRKSPGDSGRTFYKRLEVRYVPCD